MIVSYIGKSKDLKELIDIELIELLDTPNLNSTSKNQINIELIRRLNPIK